MIPETVKESRYGTGHCRDMAAACVLLGEAVGGLVPVPPELYSPARKKRDAQNQGGNR
jgi:hypothetical protein